MSVLKKILKGIHWAAIIALAYRGGIWFVPVRIMRVWYCIPISRKIAWERRIVDKKVHYGTWGQMLLLQKILRIRGRKTND